MVDITQQRTEISGIVRLVKSVVRVGETRIIFGILVMKPLERRPLVRLGMRCKNIIKMNIREIY
jgi:hypothetical protein